MNTACLCGCRGCCCGNCDCVSTATQGKQCQRGYCARAALVCVENRAALYYQCGDLSASCTTFPHQMKTSELKSVEVFLQGACCPLHFFGLATCLKKQLVSSCALEMRPERNTWLNYTKDKNCCGRAVQINQTNGRAWLVQLV